MSPTFSNDQLQSVLDHYSLGKLVSSASLGQRQLNIHEEAKEIPDLFTGKLILRKQSLLIEELVIKTTHGIFYIVTTNPNEQHWVTLSMKNWSEKLKKRLRLKNVELLKIEAFPAQPVCVHQFGTYFYLFKL